MGLNPTRPPPSYPHPKQEKPFPTSQSAAAALQFQAMKAGGVLPDQIATDKFSSIIVTGCLADEEERRFCSGVKDWSSGGGDTTIHIQTHFELTRDFMKILKDGVPWEICLKIRVK